MSTLVAFFSAEAGRTRKAAEAIAKHLNSETFEIKPEIPYSSGDLKWVNPLARCNREKLGKKDIPVEGRIDNFDSYDTVFIGFPIWYGGAPNIINTFCKDYDWSGKKVYLFATSGASGMGKSAEKLMPYVKGAEIVSEKRIKSGIDIKDWLASYKAGE